MLSSLCPFTLSPTAMFSIFLSVPSDIVTLVPAIKQLLPTPSLLSLAAAALALSLAAAASWSAFCFSNSFVLALNASNAALPFLATLACVFAEFLTPILLAAPADISPFADCAFIPANTLLAGLPATLPGSFILPNS